MGCEALLAEALTWLLAERIGVPVPGAAFCSDPADRAWLSGWVPHAKHWSPVAGVSVRNPASAAAILALDAVVFNEARHGGNILLVPAGEGAEVVAIDADEALIGHFTELERKGLVPPDPRILAAGFPPEGWEEFALDAAARIAALPAEVLLQMSDEACEIAREPSKAQVFAVLDARCRAAIPLTTGYLDRVRSIR